MTEAVCPYVLDPQGADTHGETARLREQGPIARVELPDGVLAWSVHSYRIARQIMADERFSKNPRRNWPAYINGEISDGWPLITWVAMDTMATQDGADHARLRKLLLKAFTSRRVEAMKPHIEKTVTELLDAMAAAGADAPLDLKAMFHAELPTRLMCDLFGVPEESRAEVLEGGHKNIDTRISAEVAEANLGQWQKAIADLVDYKRVNPGDDLTTAMIAAKEEDGSRLSDSEMIGTLHLLLGAGSETLVNALAHASLALLTDAGLREKVTTGEIPWENVFEETLRVESPVAHLPFRYATEDFEFEGIRIAKGDCVLIDFAGIGRDPENHGDTADEFDALRADKTHLSFGHGVHYCLGARLAKEAWMIGIPALFERFPDMELAVRRDELVGQGSFVVNGHANLPVHLNIKTKSHV
ncbi:cytochrome P450 family protein [Streptomyces cahuitamycinicus]|uniref:Cytochrome P450 n=1 Tax=Streptomyces cahuitamycinicus TaxID=2070367 RepID=A0A2N8TXT5_9ACTN|nr:cytochrome P450 [Streptomyces cahuitamycinicus]PNG23821.1 cytochrome P450 [Streptomyces cahuitamycinicus]